MGQAKSRGTYEQRRAEAIVRNAEREKSEAVERADRHQKRRKRRNGRALPLMSVLAATLSAESIEIRSAHHGEAVEP